MKYLYKLLVVSTVFFVCSVQAQDSWEQTNGPYGGNIDALAINSSGHIFAGDNEGGVFRSTDNGGNWIAIERYIRDRTEANFSHTVCPECLYEHSPTYQMKR